MSWIQTYSGKRFDLVAPDPGMVDVRDIAHALSQICRFGGHTRQFYSVAQHSVFVSYLVPPQYALLGLLHDAAEAYVGDIVPPIKRLGTMHLCELETGIQAAILHRCGVAAEPAGLSAVQWADDCALATECRDLLGGDVDGWATKLPEPAVERIVPWLTPERGAWEFSLRFVQLTVGGGTIPRAVQAMEDYLRHWQPVAISAERPRHLATANYDRPSDL